VLEDVTAGMRHGIWTKTVLPRSRIFA